MSIFEIGQNMALSNYDGAGKVMDKLSRQLTTGNKINSSKDDPVIWAKAQQDSIAFKGLQGMNDSLNLVATSIRNADAAMGAINEYIGQMKAQLNAIVKNYPPFPPGSQDRVRYLRMFNGLRAQIDALTIPPNDTGGQKIMASQSVAPGNWNVQVGENGTWVTIQKQEIHTGPTGLNIPALADTATDADINAALANLDNAQAVLATRRAGLGADASAISRSQDFNTRISTVRQSDAETWTVADTTEAGAAFKSVELKHELALQSISNLTDMRAQLLALLQ